MMVMMIPLSWVRCEIYSLTSISATVHSSPEGTTSATLILLWHMQLPRYQLKFFPQIQHY